VDFPNADLEDWFPDAIPPDVEVECADNQSNFYNLAWDKSWLIGTDSDKLIARCYFPCIIRSSFLTSTLDLRGFWYGDAKNNYGVYAVKDGSRVLTASVTHNAQGNTATFSPLSDTLVDGFEIELSSGVGSIVQYLPGNVVRTGSVNANNSGGENVPVTEGNYYSIEATGGPWRWQTIGVEGTYSFYNFWRGSGPNPVTGGLGYNDRLPGFNLFTPPGCLYAENINGVYGRAYFLADVTGIFNFCVADFNFGDNQGTLGYVLREAQAIGRRIALINLVIKNVCTS